MNEALVSGRGLHPIAEMWTEGQSNDPEPHQNVNGGDPHLIEGNREKLGVTATRVLTEIQVTEKRSFVQEEWGRKEWSTVCT